MPSIFTRKANRRASTPILKPVISLTLSTLIRRPSVMPGVLPHHHIAVAFQSLGNHRLLLVRDAQRAFDHIAPIVLRDFIQILQEKEASPTPVRLKHA